MEKKQDKGSCKQGKSRAQVIGVNIGGGGVNIGGLVVLGGTLAVTSLVAAFLVKKGSERNADKKDSCRKDNQSNRGQRSVDHQNQCCESKESPAQIDSCENLILADNPMSRTKGGNQNFTSDHHQGIVVVDDPKGINTSCDDCDGTEEFLTPVLDSRSVCEVAGKIGNDPKENKRWMERSEARRQEESEDAEKTVAEITPAVNSVDKEEVNQEVEKEGKREGDSNEEYLIQEEVVGAENMIAEETVGEKDQGERVEKGDSYEEYAIEVEAVGAEMLFPEKTKEEEQEEDSNEESVIKEEKVGAEEMVAEKTVGEKTEDKEMEKGDTYEDYAIEEEAVGAEMLAAEKTVEEEKEEEEQEEEGNTNEDHINEEEAVGAEKMVAEKAVEEKEKEEDEGDTNEEHFIEEEGVGAKNMVGEKAAEEEEDEGDINGKYVTEEEAVGAEKMTAEKAEAMDLVEDEEEHDEEEEEDSNDGYEEGSVGTGSASTESNAEAIWPAESLEALSRELKNTMINLQTPGEKIVEEDGSTKTKEFGDFNSSKSNILKNDLDNRKATENQMNSKEEEMPGLVQIIEQTADSTKRKFWIWTTLALALLLLLAFAHHSALSYHFVNPSSFLVHDEL